MKIALKVKVKAFFITFKGLSFANNYLKPESAPLSFTVNKEKGEDTLLSQ